MKWNVEYQKIFLKELYHLPKSIRDKAENIIFKKLGSINPFDLGIVEKMQGYPDKYKIRIGNYRIGLTIDKENSTITCDRIAHRRDIYRIFP